jgi:hypothetical protein
MMVNKPGTTGGPCTRVGGVGSSTHSSLPFLIGASQSSRHLSTMLVARKGVRAGPPSKMFVGLHGTI